jgi:hypothetical protein
MDPVTLIVMALAAGAALGLKDAASSSAVRDAYGALKALVRSCVAGRPDGDLVVARYEQAPKMWEAPLAAELTVVGAGSDADLLAAAQALIRMFGEAGSRSGKYSVIVQRSAGCASR